MTITFSKKSEKVTKTSTTLKIIGYSGVALILSLIIIGCSFPYIRNYYQEKFVNDAKARISILAPNSKWLKEQDDQITSDNWYSEDYLKMKDGSYVICENKVSHYDWIIGDIFVGYASDGTWIISHAHFCINLIGLTDVPQPENLLQFKHMCEKSYPH